MPLYEFACPTGHRTEQRFTMAEAPAQIECMCGDSARRVFIAPHVPLLGYDAGHRRRRRPNPADHRIPGAPDESKARR